MKAVSTDPSSDRLSRVNGSSGQSSGELSKAMMAGMDSARAIVTTGAALFLRIYEFPRPVVVACTGHAIAMGAFLVCSGDYRFGAAGEFRIQANEVAIGLTVPLAALAILRHRLTPSAFDRAAILSEVYTPQAAVAAGFLDAVVEPDAVVGAAQSMAADLAGLDLTAHAATKQRVRGELVAEIQAGIRTDFGE